MIRGFIARLRAAWRAAQAFREELEARQVISDAHHRARARILRVREGPTNIVPVAPERAWATRWKSDEQLLTGGTVAPVPDEARVRLALNDALFEWWDSATQTWRRGPRDARR